MWLLIEGALVLRIIGFDPYIQHLEILLSDVDPRPSISVLRTEEAPKLHSADGKFSLYPTHDEQALHGFHDPFMSGGT